MRERLANDDVPAVQGILNRLHRAEIANVLETLPPEQRLAPWRLLAAPFKGEVLIEARREVREHLMGATEADELVAALTRVDIDALADIDHALPAAVVDAVPQAMDMQRRQRAEAVRAYPTTRPVA